MADRRPPRVRAAAWLTGAGLRPTRQRLALAELLVGDGRNRHVTAESLHEAARRLDAPVSLATVYNTLRAFCDAGLHARGDRRRHPLLLRHPHRRPPALLLGGGRPADRRAERRGRARRRAARPRGRRARPRRRGDPPAPPAADDARLKDQTAMRLSASSGARIEHARVPVQTRDRRLTRSSRPARRPRAPRAAASPRPRRPRSRTRPRAQASSRATTPGSAIARTAAASAGPARSGTGAVAPHQRGAHPREQRVVHPAAGAVGVAHPPPLPVLGGDLERQAAAHELPVDPLVEARARAGRWRSRPASRRSAAAAGWSPARAPAPPPRPRASRAGQRRRAPARAATCGGEPSAVHRGLSCSRASRREVSGFPRPPRAIIPRA